MTAGSIILVALCYALLGVFIGFRLSKWQRAARTKRRIAARLSLYQQLHQLQTARREGHSVPAVHSHHRRAA
jgi:hypothetical protein